MVVRQRAIDRIVVPMRMEQDRGKYRHDIGRGIVRANAYASGIDAIGSYGNTAADGRPGRRIIGSTTAKGSAEQNGTEQGGKALHSGSLQEA